MGTVQEEGEQGPLLGTAKVRFKASFLPQGRDLGLSQGCNPSQPIICQWQIGRRSLPELTGSPVLQGPREAEAMVTTVPG